MVNKYLSGLLFGSIYQHFYFFGKGYLFNLFFCLLEMTLFNTVQT